HPKKRGEIWEKSSIIIGTPQTLAEELKKDKDLFQGGIDLRDVSFVALDEAHKVVSKEDKYAYQKIVEKYKKDNPAGLLLGICPTLDEQRMTDIRTKMGLDNIVRRTKKDPGVRESFHEITRRSVYINALDTKPLEDIFWAIMTEAFDRLRGIIYDSEQNRFEIISNRIGIGPGGYLPGIQEKINQYRSFLLESNIEITGRKGSQCYQLMHSLKKHLYQYLKYADFERIGKMLDHDIGAARKKDHKQKGKFLRRLKADWAMIGEVRHALQLARLDYIEELGKYLERIKNNSHRMVSYKWLSEDSRFENALGLLGKVDQLNRLRAKEKLSATEEVKLRRLEASETIQGLSGDPRTEKLLEILPEHKDKRIMVYVEYKYTAEKILKRIQALNDPEIKAAKFIGKKGMSQKKQKEVLAKFREGEFNVLILTSAGEEGLDFKDAVVINFQAISRKKSRIQRRGRTGRREPGLEITLKTKGYEEKIDFIGAAREKSTDRSLKKLSKTDT
ncbi:MAG: helicase-related protein, partial [Candidatus Margulisiibacteriota bacterium]